MLTYSKEMVEFGLQDIGYRVRTKSVKKAKMVVVREHLATPLANADNCSEFGNSVNIILFYLRLMSIYPLHYKNGSWRSSKCSFTFFFSFLVWLILLVNVSFVWYQNIKRVMNETFAEYIIELGLHFLLLQVYFLPTIHWRDNKRLAIYLNAWKKFESDFFKLTGTSLKLRMKRKIAVVTCTVLLTVIIASVLRILFFNSPIVSALLISYVSFCAFLLCYFWTANCRALITAAKMLTAFLEQVLLSEEKRCNIPGCMGLWLSLSKLTSMLGSSLYLTYLHFLSVIFIMKTTSVYALFNFGSSSRMHAEPCMLLFIAVFCVSALFQICLSAANVIETLQTDITCILLRSKSLQDKEEAREEVKLFLLAISMSSTEISLRGYLTINSHLITTIISAMIAYLIVLMQIRLGISSTNEKKNTTFCNYSSYQFNDEAR